MTTYSDRQKRKPQRYPFEADGWRQMINRSDVLILDTETSGLDENAEALEVGIIDTKGTEVLHSFVLPEFSISRASTEVHGLDRRLLKLYGAQPWPYVHDEICGLLSEASAVVIYNAEYDIRVLRQTAGIHGLTISGFDYHCAMLAYASYRNEIHPRFNNPRWHKLSAAARHEKVAVKQEHEALSDCHMVLALMRAVSGR